MTRDGRHRDSYRALVPDDWKRLLLVVAMMVLALWGVIHLLGSHPQTPSGLLTATWKIFVYEAVLFAAVIAIMAGAKQLNGYIHKRKHEQ